MLSAATTQLRPSVTPASTHTLIPSQQPSPIMTGAVPVIHQGMTTPAPVIIGDGCWLGINVCVLAGVTLGRNGVVAANSVVTSSFPDGSVIGGAPARLLRSLTSPTRS